MKRFFDWLVKGMEAAAERNCAKAELERAEQGWAAEKRGLQEAHERQVAHLYSQMKHLKEQIAHAEARLKEHVTIVSPLDVAARMQNEGLIYHEAEHHGLNILITDALRKTLIAASEQHRVSVRQVLTGMVAMTWPSK